MIIARVEGGLGNQLFIYAAARALALRAGATLKLDPWSIFPHDSFGRRYQLDEFNIAASLAEEVEVVRFRPKSRSFSWRRKLDRRLPFPWRLIVEEGLVFEPRLLELRPRRDVYLVGYWQREAYFRDQAPAIRRELTLRREPSAQNRALGDGMRQCESAFVHVRRIDYAHRLSAGYYAVALKTLYERVKEPKLFVFGDDLEWARRELPLPGGTKFVEHNGDDRNVEDLWLMTRCRHAIVANSSFSWWGAWLNAEPERVVIAPATWGYRAAAASGWMTVDG